MSETTKLKSITSIDELDKETRIKVKEWISPRLKAHSPDMLSDIIIKCYNKAVEADEVILDHVLIEANEAIIATIPEDKHEGKKTETIFPLTEKINIIATLVVGKRHSIAIQHTDKPDKLIPKFDSSNS